jgi:putative ABC transport system ATP-binding protein
VFINHFLREKFKMSKQKAIIKTSKLCKTYLNGGVEQHILKNIEIKIYKGDFTIIMGASGAGKSTLLYALSGMDEATSGDIHFLNQEISQMNNDQLSVFRRDNCGFVFQQIYLLDNMSVLDNVLTSGFLVNKNRKEVVSHAKGLLTRFDIDQSEWNKLPSQISGGQAQRVGVARSLINSPKILFADEPTGALNSANGKAVLDALTESNEAGQSIVMVTHDIRSARRGNRILYLRDGVVIGECNLGKYKREDPVRKEKLRTFLQEMGY